MLYAKITCKCLIIVNGYLGAATLSHNYCTCLQQSTNVCRATNDPIGECNSMDHISQGNCFMQQLHCNFARTIGELHNICWGERHKVKSNQLESWYKAYCDGLWKTWVVCKQNIQVCKCLHSFCSIFHRSVVQLAISLVVPDKTIVP